MATTSAIDGDGVATERPSHTDDLATADDASKATISIPLFRPPREVRDMIYDLIIPSESEIHCVLTLEPGKQPQTTIFAATSGAAHTCHQLNEEYKAAIESWVTKLMSGKKVGGLKLDGPGPCHRLLSNGLPQFEITLAQKTGAKRRVQAVKIRITIREGFMGVATLLLTFRFPLSEEVESSHQRFNIVWGRDPFCDEIRLMAPASLEPSLHQVMETAKAVEWNGSLREYFLWQKYFVRYAREAWIMNKR